RRQAAGRHSRGPRRLSAPGATEYGQVNERVRTCSGTSYSSQSDVAWPNRPRRRRAHMLSETTGSRRSRTEAPYRSPGGAAPPAAGAAVRTGAGRGAALTCEADGILVNGAPTTDPIDALAVGNADAASGT